MCACESSCLFAAMRDVAMIPPLIFGHRAPAASPHILVEIDFHKDRLPHKVCENKVPGLEEHPGPPAFEQDCGEAMVSSGEGQVPSGLVLSMCATLVPSSSVATAG